MIKNNWEFKLLLFLIERVQGVIVIDLNSYCAIKSKAKNSRIFNIPNPCSLEVEKIANEELSSTTSLNFIFVGHVIESKGINELIDAFLSIENDISLTLIGPIQRDYKNQIINLSKRKYNGNWLQIEGEKNRSEVIEKMKNAYCLLLPSYTEGFPNVILESMACGCPVIATNVGAIPQMLDSNLDEKSGICVDKQNVQQLKLAILEIISNRPLRDQMASNGKRKILREYTLAKIVSSYIEIWK